MNGKFDWYERALKKRLEQNHYRQLRCVVPLDEANIISQEKKLVNFASGDYLGLSRHPYVKKTTIKYVLQWGVGSTASRLVTGHLECHRDIEERLAHLLGTQNALLFSSGYSANQSIIPALANSRSLIFIDRFCHSSLIGGAMHSGAKVIRFEHNDPDHLKQLLEKHRHVTASSKLIITESLFNMEGDLAPLRDISYLAKEHAALLYVDDAQSVGILGKNGMGLGAQKSGIDIVVGTFGKACGSFGGYIGCGALLRDYLVNFCPGFIYTTALPPAILGAIDAALTLIPDMEAERQEVLKRSRWLRQRLQQAGFSTGLSQAHIVPIMVESESDADDLFDHLTDAGVMGQLIKPPTVPPNGSRIRLAVNAQHTEAQLERLLQALQTWKRPAAGQVLAEASL